MNFSSSEGGRGERSLLSQITLAPRCGPCRARSARRYRPDSNESRDVRQNNIMNPLRTLIMDQRSLGTVFLCANIV